MRSSVGLWDSLFGERMTIEVPGPNGQVIKRQVTQKWLAQMRRAGRVKAVEGPLVRVHMLNPLGNTTQHWKIGQDIDQAAVDKFRDPESGDIYGMTSFENGESQVHLLRRDLWEAARQAMNSV
jgi:hypothetical protein